MYQGWLTGQRAENKDSGNQPDADAWRAGDLDGLMTCIFDELDYGLAVVTPVRQVLFSNREARRHWADPSAGEHVKDGLIHARCPHADQALHGALLDATRGRRRLLFAADRGCRRALAVIPLAETVHRPSVALLVYSKCAVSQQLSVDFFAREHGLTDAERRTLADLCAGDSPAAAAEHHGLGVSTIRSQIASIREKTMTASVVELVRRVALLPPIVGHVLESQPQN